MTWREIYCQWKKSLKLTPMHKPPILKAILKESPMLDLLLFFTVSTKFCSPVLLSSHKTTQFPFMCPLGDPNSGSSGMCVCVCVCVCVLGGRACGLWNACQCVRGSAWGNVWWLRCMKGERNTFNVRTHTICTPAKNTCREAHMCMHTNTRAIYVFGS